MVNNRGLYRLVTLPDSTHYGPTTSDTGLDGIYQALHDPRRGQQQDAWQLRQMLVGQSPPLSDGIDCDALAPRAPLGHFAKRCLKTHPFHGVSPAGHDGRSRSRGFYWFKPPFMPWDLKRFLARRSGQIQPQHPASKQSNRYHQQC